MDNRRDDEIFHALRAASTSERLLNWCDEAALVHWVEENDREPDWYEAHRRIQQEGRRSKVRFPSPAHEKYEIPRPARRG